MSYTETQPNNLIDGYLCWPFTSKGHFHLPSGIAPVIMDIKARYHKETRIDEPFLYLPYSWNVNGKPATDQVLTKIIGVSREKLHEDEGLYLSLMMDNLKEVINVASSSVDENIKKSKSLMSPLSLMEGGLYQNGEVVRPFEFRDDSDEYSAYVQRRFLEWYKNGTAYLTFDSGKPCFYLNIEKLYKEKPLKDLMSGLNTEKGVSLEFANNYRIYNKDLPISTIGGYATPVPVYVDDKGKVEIPEIDSRPIDPRLLSENKNHLLVIKPLINCYLFMEYLAEKFHGFQTVSIGNDHHMATRVNFVSTLLSRRHYQIMNLYIFNLLQDSTGNTYSFKKGVVQSLEELEEQMEGLSRFAVIKNTRLGYGSLKVNIDAKTLARVQKLLHQSDHFVPDDIVYSKMFKRNVSLKETVHSGLEKGNVSQVLNFLTDALTVNPDNATARYYLSLFLPI